MGFDRYLDANDIAALLGAFRDAGLMELSTQRALKLSLDPTYRHFLNENPNPKVQLFDNLNTMNREHNLRNGDVPLAQFLAAAIVLSEQSPAADVIDRALKRIRYSGESPPAEASIASMLKLPTADSPAAVSLEAQTNAFDQTVSVRFLTEGVVAARSVMKILVHRHMEGEAEFVDGDRPRLVNGTAWFIAPRLVITNHHVVNARRKEGVKEPDASEDDFRLQAENSTLLFDYVRKDVEPKELRLGRGTLMHADKNLDFALLQLPEGAEERPSLRLRAKPIMKRVDQAFGTGVNLLQHPNGDPMRLGFRNNYVVVGTVDALSYLTDTAVGSSGSPVCDDGWAVAALHSGSQRISKTSVEILGHKYTRENFGVPLAAILSNIQNACPAAYEAIMAGQA